MIYVMYNDYAGDNTQNDKKQTVRDMFAGEEIEFHDVVKIDDKLSFMKKLTSGDKLVIMGGDGTLNHFVNGIDDTRWDFPIYCYAAGTGNDFLNDVAGSDKVGLFQINDYIYDLPTATVNGQTYKFLNGIGYGIDGYCCEEGDAVRAKGQNPNYTSIAIKGLFGKFKPLKAKVTVDGEVHEFDHVWLAPSMHGRFYGGGMMIAPEQKRLDPEHNITLVVAHCKSRLRLFTIFPSIFKGTHVKYKKQIEIYTGKHIKVEFDAPCALQVDGETIKDVTSYESFAYSPVKEEATV